MTASEATGDERLKVKPPKQWATGLPAVMHALEYLAGADLASANRDQSAEHQPDQRDRLPRLCLARA